MPDGGVCTVDELQDSGRGQLQGRNAGIGGARGPGNAAVSIPEEKIAVGSQLQGGVVSDGAVGVGRPDHSQGCPVGQRLSGV